MSDQIQAEISQSIKSLRDSHDNLKEIVRHCTTINQNQGNREQALLETKNYALQALSSVAYQVNIAASKFEELLGWQQGEIDSLSAELNTVYNGIGFSGEAASTAVLSEQGVKFQPVNGTKAVKLPERAFSIEDKSYVRIDYRLLDNVGIGQREFMSSAPASAPASAAPVPGTPSTPQEGSGLTRTNTTSSAILSFKKQAPSSAPRPPTVMGTPSISVPRAPSVYSNAEAAFDAPPPPPASLPPPPPPASTEPSQVNVSVIYDYQAQNHDELTIKAGEILFVLNPDVGGGWMEGRNSAGQTGIFPQSYVEII